MNDPVAVPPSPSLGLRVGLWVAQTLVFVLFVMTGVVKLVVPIPDLARMVPWTGQLPILWVHATGLIDLAGGLGILLPALTRIRPRLTVWAALGCSALQVCATVFHTTRGEAGVTPLNYGLLALCMFVWWGRSRRALIAPR